MTDEIDWSKIGKSVIEDDDAMPRFESVNEVEYSRVEDDNEPSEEQLLAEASNIINLEEPIKRPRGRPKGSRNKQGTTRDAREVSERLQGILEGGTGMLAIMRPHFQMTEEEAKDIANPLSAYLVRQEENSEYIREFLDKYDVIAAGIAVLTYLIRVWRDESDYRAETESSGERGQTGIQNPVQNVQFREQEEQGNGTGSEVPREVGWISTPYISG